MKATAYFILIAVVLAINAVSLIGAMLLDKMQYTAITESTEARLEQRFRERSTQIGAWVMDRECITEHIGFPVGELPSYKWAQKHKQEAK
jgi:hypothetical protein